MLSHVFCDLNNIFNNLINILKLTGLGMDAKEWSKMADMLAQIRNKLYIMESDNENINREVFLKSVITREYLALVLINIDTFARWDDNGWIE